MKLSNNIPVRVACVLSIRGRWFALSASLLGTLGTGQLTSRTTAQ